MRQYLNFRKNAGNDQRKSPETDKTQSEIFVLIKLQFITHIQGPSVHVRLDIHIPLDFLISRANDHRRNDPCILPIFSL